MRQDKVAPEWMLQVSTEASVNIRSFRVWVLEFRAQRSAKALDVAVVMNPLWPCYTRAPQC